MYNTQLKKAFLNYKRETVVEQTLQVYKAIFNILEKYEVVRNADVCTYDKQTLLDIFNDCLSHLRQYTIKVYLKVLQEYTAWCTDNKVEGVKDDINEVLPNEIITYGLKRKFVSSPTHLQEYLDAVFDPESDQCVDNIYRCYLWLAFMGVYPEDVLSVKCSDVDLEDMTLSYHGKNIPLYPESISCFKNAATLNSFQYKHHFMRTLCIKIGQWEIHS